MTLKINLSIPVRIVCMCKFSFRFYNSISKVQCYKEEINDVENWS